jgi:hypothetical protein
MASFHDGGAHASVAVQSLGNHLESTIFKTIEKHFPLWSTRKKETIAKKGIVGGRQGKGHVVKAEGVQGNNSPPLVCRSGQAYVQAPGIGQVHSHAQPEAGHYSPPYAARQLFWSSHQHSLSALHCQQLSPHNLCSPLNKPVLLTLPVTINQRTCTVVFSYPPMQQLLLQHFKPKVLPRTPAT